VIATLVAVLALAQDVGKGVDIQVAQPTPFAESGVLVDRAVAGQQWNFAAQLLFNYNLNPLIWRYPNDAEVVAVKGTIYGNVMGSVTLLDWLQAGIVLPVALGFIGGDLGGLAAAPSVGLGDLRLLLKLQFLREDKHYVSVAFIPDIALPTGGGQAYYSSSTVTASPRLAVSRRLHRTELALNFGARVRGVANLPGVQVGSQLTYGGSARIDLPWPVGKTSLEAIGELWGLTSAIKPWHSLDGSVLEFLISGRLGLLQQFFLTASAGAGLLPGYGSPDLRVYLGVAYAPRDEDRDFDGVPDRLDKCPDIPGPKANDGCPYPDRDNDGVPDYLDKCPDVPGPKDNNGCPKPRKIRLCDEGPGEDDSEPDDKPVKPCVHKPPPVDPKLDTDHDGIPDIDDKCPLEPETINGVDDDDGCPDEGQGVTVFLSKQEIRILQKINFETAKAVIKPESYHIVDEVSAQLRAHPEVLKLRIEGHTDSVGSDAYNLKLSQDRAVKAYIVAKKVEAGRLIAVGYGESKPIASNKTPFGRAQNRRVQFVILEQSGD
jgi:outer membrane protein OmpA-like peptidoglycan-associated protein